MFQKQKKIIIFLIISLVIMTFAIEYSNFDITVQNILFNFETKHWLINRNDKVLRIIFYQLPKILILFFILRIILVARLKRKQKVSIKNEIILIVSLILTPLICAGLKEITNTPCPWDTNLYNGQYPYTKFFEKIVYFQKNKFKCFPAGHASIGFSLVALYYYWGDNIFKRRVGLFIGIIAGGIMASYQMLKGAHFLSHNMASLIIALTISTLLFNLVHKKNAIT